MSDTAATKEKTVKRAEDFDDTAITFIDDEVKKDGELPPPSQLEQQEQLELR